LGIVGVRTSTVAASQGPRVSIALVNRTSKVLNPGHEVRGLECVRVMIGAPEVGCIASSVALPLQNYRTVADPFQRPRVTRSPRSAHIAPLAGKMNTSSPSPHYAFYMLLKHLQLMATEAGVGQLSIEKLRGCDFF